VLCWGYRYIVYRGTLWSNIQSPQIFSNVLTLVTNSTFLEYVVQVNGVSKAKDYGLDGWGSVACRDKIFLLFKSILGHTQPLIQFLSVALSLGVKSVGHETVHSSPFSAEVKNDGAIPTMFFQKCSCSQRNILWIFSWLQKHFVVCCMCRDAAKLFRFLLLPYSPVETCNNVQNSTFHDSSGCMYYFRGMPYHKVWDSWCKLWKGLNFENQMDFSCNFIVPYIVFCK
jgi:hypothetical protein